VPTASELRELDDEELHGRLGEYRRELLNLRFQVATGQLDNVARIPRVRRDVARVLTVLRDREIALAEGRPAGPVLSTTRRRRTEADELEEAPAAPRARRRRAAPEPEDAGEAEAIDLGQDGEIAEDEAEAEFDEGLDEVDELDGTDVDDGDEVDEEDG